MRMQLHTQPANCCIAVGNRQLSLHRTLHYAIHQSRNRRPTYVVHRAVSPADAPTVSSAVPQQLTATTAQDTWALFAANASGEWEGVTATFSPDGTPQPLPEHYVPGAYRDWGVELWDWQSQCSSLATAAEAAAEAGQAAGDTTQQLYRSVVRRLMPTVGCEADAVAFTEEDACSSSSSCTSTEGSSAAGSTFICTAEGSYSSGPQQLPPIGDGTGPSKFSIEHCFVLPGSTSTASGTGLAPAEATGNGQQGSSNVSGSSSSRSRIRVKVVQQFRKDWSKGAWLLAAVDLHKECFDGPYTGKRELAGCGGGQPGIAQLPALQQQLLAGTWTTASSFTTSTNSSTNNTNSTGSSTISISSSSLSCLGGSGSAPSGVQLTLLPLQSWSAVQVTPEGHVQRVEAGVVLGGGQQEGHSIEQQSRLVSVRSYEVPSGQLEAALLGQEAVVV